MKTFLVKEVIIKKICHEVKAGDRYEAEKKFLNGRSKRKAEWDSRKKKLMFIELADEAEND